MTYPIHRIIDTECTQCGATVSQPSDDENTLCLNCRYPIPEETA